MDVFQKTDHRFFLQGVKDCIPTLLGYISIGFAFGVVGAASGLNNLEVWMLSALVYAGSAQFIFCSLYVAGAPALILVLTIFIVNLRHLLMAFSIAPYFNKESILKNVGFGTLLTDETFGVAIVKGAKYGKLNGNWMNGLNLTAYFVWILACLSGSFFAAFISNPDKWGLDYALVAMFIALLVLNISYQPTYKLRRNLYLVTLTICCMYVLTLWISSYLATLLATMIVATIGVVTER